MKFKLNKSTLFFVILGVLFITHFSFNVREYFSDKESSDNHADNGNSSELIELKPDNYFISGKGITAHKGHAQVKSIKTEGDKYVFMAEDGDNTLVVKSTDKQGDSTGYYYKGKISDYNNDNLISTGKDFKVSYLKVGNPPPRKSSSKSESYSGDNDPLAITSNSSNSTNPMTTPSISTAGLSGNIGNTGSLDYSNGDDGDESYSNNNSSYFSSNLNEGLISNRTNYYGNRSRGVPRSLIPPGDEDLYILKSEIVPPVCPKCPDVTVCPKNEKCPPCPPCARCPEPSFECKKVPNYNRKDDTYLPRPILSDFSQFGM